MSEHPFTRRTLLRLTGAGMASAGMAGATAATAAATDDADADSAPIEIEDWNDLGEIREELDGEYVLVNDLDAATDGYDEQVAAPEEGWDPIGGSAPFTGTFDGDGHEISDLQINRVQADSIGLFARIEDATVRDLTVSDVDITGGGDAERVGSLVGDNDASTVLNVTVSGEISADVRFVGGLIGEHGELTGDDAEATVTESAANIDITANSPAVGGLVGANNAEVTDVSTSGSVDGGDTNTTFRNSIGGVVGINRGYVSETSTTCTVKGVVHVGGVAGYNDEDAVVVTSSASEPVAGEEDVGGLLGTNEGHLEESTTEATVDGDSDVGGAVGVNRGGVIEETSASGTVSGESEVGGLVGTNGVFDPGTIRSADADGDVTGNTDVGGLVGRHSDGTVDGASASGTVSGESNIGGLVGITHDGEIIDSAASGTVTGDDDVGGLVGYHQSTIEASSASGDVAGERDVGGLVGFSNEEIRESSASGDVSGTDGDIGGLVGTNVGEVVKSAAAGDVTGENNGVGGLIGNNIGTVIEASASGSVTSTDSLYTGGLVGDNLQPGSADGRILDCRATGNVDGDGVVGGVVGRSSGRIEKTLSAGTVAADRLEVGSLVGRLGARFLEADEEAVLRDSYWDSDVANQPEAIGDFEEGDGIAESRGDVAGLSTSQMQGETAADTMSTLDFVQIWTVRTDPDDYPRLQFQDESDTEPAPDPPEGWTEAGLSEEQFAAVDQNGDGVLTRGDVRNAVQGFVNEGAVDGVGFTREEIRKAVQVFIQT